MQRPDPRLVLLVAAILPGVGHVLTGRAARGLGFAFFALTLGWLTSKFASPDASVIGKHAGGFFVWALSLPDAYRFARLDRERETRDARASALKICEKLQNPPQHTVST